MDSKLPQASLAIAASTLLLPQVPRRSDRNARYVDYINKYSALAVEQMKDSQDSRQHHSGTGIA